MIRLRGTKASGQGFTKEEAMFIWRQYFAGLVFAKDICGAMMHRDEFGNIDSKFGWEINHIIPVSKGGQDVPENLQPLHWQNNRAKEEDYPADPSKFCVVNS